MGIRISLLFLKRQKNQRGPGSMILALFHSFYEASLFSLHRGAGSIVLYRFNAVLHS